MTRLISVAFTFVLALSANAQDQPDLPRQQPFNPNASANLNVGGNPFTFNSMNPPYGRGGNPYSLREPDMPPIAESPLKSFEQTGAFRGAFVPPPVDTDSMGSIYGHYADRHSLDSLNSIRGSDNPLSPFGKGWRLERTR